IFSDLITFNLYSLSSFVLKFGLESVPSSRFISLPLTTTNDCGTLRMKKSRLSSLVVYLVVLHASTASTSSFLLTVTYAVFVEFSCLNLSSLFDDVAVL